MLAGSSARFSVPRSTPTDPGSPDMLESTGRSGNALYISHNAVDRPYAVALETAIHELLDSDTLIDVRYSTSDEAGPQGGEKWREWMQRCVQGRCAHGWGSATLPRVGSHGDAAGAFDGD